MAPERETFFATCPPHFERVLQRECKEQRLSRIEAQPGGVQFAGPIEDAWRANLWLRTASRVLMRVARFPAKDADELYAGAREVDWERFVTPDGTIAVDARGKSPALRNTQFMARKVKDAIVDAFRDKHGRRPSVSLDDPDALVHCRLTRDRVTLLVDTSGAPLFKRGWRAAHGVASLKETLAAFLVLSSGWDRRAPLLDPFCGSGTILVEAGMIAKNIAPNLERERFGFSRWPGFNSDAFEKARAQARTAAVPVGKLALRGWDVDPKAVAIAGKNLEAVGLGDNFVIEQADARAFAPKKGWNATIVTNPPYGERVGNVEKLRPIIRVFGENLKRHAGGYRLAMLSGHPALTKALDMSISERIPVRNGPLECELILIDIPR